MEKIGNLFNPGDVISPKHKDRWLSINMTAAQFRSVFKKVVPEVMERNNLFFDFKFDENNIEFINQMYFYLSGDPKFNGDHNKGILLLGAIGAGKTFLMQCMFEIILLYNRIIVAEVHSKNLANEIEAKGMEYYRKRPMYVQDIGKEEKSVNHYGTIKKPFEDLISFRYTTGAVTFGCGNYKMDTYQDFYSTHIVDRMKELFNIVILKGESKR